MTVLRYQDRPYPRSTHDKCHRSTVRYPEGKEVHEASRPLRSLLPDFPGLSSRHPGSSRRYVNRVLAATGLVDDAELPAIRRRLTHGRVGYKLPPEVVR